MASLKRMFRKLSGLRKAVSRRQYSEDEDRWLLRGWVMWEVRDLDRRFSLPSNSKTDDAIVETAARRLIGNPDLDEFKSIIGVHEELIEKLCGKAKAEEIVRVAVARVQRFDAGVFRKLGYDAIAEARVALAMATYPEQPELSEVVTEADRKAIQRRIQEIRRNIANDHGFRLNLTLGDVASVLGLVSVLLLLIGYLRATFLLKGIGLDASHVLTISDYLSASASSYWYIVLPAAFTVVSFLFGVVSTSRLSRAENAKVRMQRIKIGKVYLSIITFTFALFFGTLIYHDGALRTIAVFGPWFIMVGLVALAHRVAGVSFKDPVLPEALMMFAISMTAAVSVSTIQDVFALRDGKWHKADQTKIQLKSSLPLAGADLRIVIAGSEFIVFWDNERRRAYAVPRDAVELVAAEP